MIQQEVQNPRHLCYGDRRRNSLDFPGPAPPVTKTGDAKKRPHQKEGPDTLPREYRGRSLRPLGRSFWGQPAEV
jgi:hypothetical protein